MYKIIIYVLLHCSFSYKQAKSEKNSRLKLEQEDRMGTATFCKDCLKKRGTSQFFNKIFMEHAEGHILKLNFETIVVVSTICIQDLLFRNILKFILN